METTTMGLYRSISSFPANHKPDKRLCEDGPAVHLEKALGFQGFRAKG